MSAELETLDFNELLDEAEVATLSARHAVAGTYFRVPGRMDIRELWRRDGVHYFRVNFWKFRPDGDPYVWQSAFVAVEHTPAGPVVRELTLRRAA